MHALVWYAYTHNIVRTHMLAANLVTPALALSEPSVII